MMGYPKLIACQRPERWQVITCLGFVRKVPARRSCCVENRLGMLIYNL